MVLIDMNEEIKDNKQHMDMASEPIEAAAMIEAGLDEVDAGIVICHDCHVSSVKGMPSLP